MREHGLGTAKTWQHFLYALLNLNRVHDSNKLQNVATSSPFMRGMPLLQAVPSHHHAIAAPLHEVTLLPAAWSSQDSLSYKTVGLLC